MKYALLSFVVGGLATVSAQGQVTVSASDMFGEAGLYYRAYSNPFNPLSLGAAGFPTDNVMGSAGPDQFWDFSKGPTDVVYRFDYIDAAEVTEALDFPLAKIVERKTEEASGRQEMLFFEQIPGNGRRVYGFWADSGIFTPVNVFVPPIVDFPENIRYGDEWSTATTYENSVFGTDPDPEEEGGGGFDIAVQYTHTSSFKVDAHGTIVLPDELGAFGPGLRINESVTIDLAVDDGTGSFQHVETDFSRTFYWVMPGRGIVATLASRQSSTPPPDNFSTATQFWRMFETNKKPSASTNGCADPNPVTDLKIRVNSGQALLSWSKAPCATQYRLEYSNGMSPLTWTPLGTFTNQLFMLDNTQLDQQRFYRVISIK